MADQKKICPVMSASPEVRRCVEERCQWWLSPEMGSSGKGDCVIQAIRTTLYLTMQKT